jgi:GWxTD domain-containing protein
MTFRKFGVAAISLTLFSVGAVAQSPALEFGKGAAQYLMTPAEVAEWKNVKTADEAQAFIDLFWARRDPTPDTPQNEFADEFDARVEYADKKWSDKKTKGSMTDRGRMVIILGTKAKVTRSGQASDVPAMPGDSESAATRDTGPAQERWTFDRASLPKFAEGKGVDFLFIDRFRNGSFALDKASQTRLNDLTAKAAAASIVRPELTAARTQAAPKQVIDVAIPAPVIKQTTAPVVTSFQNAALAEVVKAFKSATVNPYKNIYATYAEGVTADGEYFVPVQLLVPKSDATAAGSYTFLGQVEDAAGKVVAVYEEAAKLVESKNDLYFDKTLTLPSGKYTGYFGLVGADGKALGVVKLPMTLTSIDKSAVGTSKLILSNNIYALPQAQKPTDPFAWGGLKVVPKADRTFLTTDELDYFVELRNPALGADGKPRFQAGIDIVDAKGNRKTSPPAEVDVLALKGSEGRYFIGSGYPLDSFAPGKYTMKMKLYDMVDKKNYSFEEKFTVVGVK